MDEAPRKMWCDDRECGSWSEGFSSNEDVR